MKSKRRRTGAAPVEVTAEQRFHLINDVAYFRSLQQRAEPLSADDPARCWCGGRGGQRMRNAADRVLVCCLAVLLAAPACADEARGRALYENHCQACHSKKVHQRERSVVLNADELRRIVANWQQEEKLNWSREDLDDVVSYLRAAQ